ncbi:MAG TPA: class I SAM-dependent methyltransferase [Dongiaceae bacterium]|nr:class I SAM-dependent methyltransferase [Dongiaceae bacterium]
MSRPYWRRLALGLPTLLGAAPRGYFIPCRQAGALPAPAGYPALEPAFAAAAPAMRARLGALGGLPARPRLARWDQDWFPRLDAAIAYDLVRERRPRRIVEVGSGHSTRFLAEAVADADTGSALLAIDPAPRADIAAVGAKRVAQAVPACGAAPFAGLGPGDMLVVDSSHVLMPGSDVDFLVNGILPALPGGALVHFHDIFLPDGYPAAWGWRGYNEQLAVAALIAGGAWRILFSSRYAVTRLAEEVAASAVSALPLLPGAYESSLWLERG